jgi:hypothetical protein
MGRALTTALLVAILGAVHAGTARVRAATRAAAQSVLHRTRLAKLIAFYRHFAFDLPRSTTAAGVGLVLGIAAIRLYLLADAGPPAYLGAYFALIGVLATAAAVAMLAARRPGIVRLGWALGTLAALATLGMYLASRTLGLPELDRYVGRWDHPLGTFGMILSASYVGLHFAVVTKLTVAYPHHQQWRD